VTIRPLNETDSMAELTALVRTAYQRLADMGLRFMGTWQGENDTRERCEEGHCLVAEHEGRLVGTVTVRNPDCDDDPEWYRREGVWVVGQFAVRPDMQNAGLGSKLMAEAERHAFSNGAEEVSIDTAEGATHLVEYYAKRGYRHVGTVDWGGHELRQRPNEQAVTSAVDDGAACAARTSHA
jgi:GNAT superfamily N-acetyltransferase